MLGPGAQSVTAAAWTESGSAPRSGSGPNPTSCAGGFATSALAAGASERAVREHGRWRSAAAMAPYIDEAEGFADTNPAATSAADQLAGGARRPPDPQWGFEIEARRCAGRSVPGIDSMR
jgi:hypothetical protein